jgi:hypothetical protein
MARILAELEGPPKAAYEYSDEHPEATLAELERKLFELSRDCFAVVLAELIEERRQAEEGGLVCPCGGRLRYKGEQARQQETLVGLLQWRRGYYCCQGCGRGRYPLDEALEVAAGQLSEGVQEKVARLGVTLPFREAAQELWELAGIAVSAREVARITEQRGQVLEEEVARERRRLLEGGEPVRCSRRGHMGQMIWAVALDAAKVRFEDGWHEVKAGAVFWVEGSGSGGSGQARGQSYIAQVGCVEQAGERPYAEVIGRGVDPAVETLVCLGDGASGIWNQYALQFPTGWRSWTGIMPASTSGRRAMGLLGEGRS